MFTKSARRGEEKSLVILENFKEDSRPVKVFCESVHFNFYAFLGQTRNVTTFPLGGH